MSISLEDIYYPLDYINFDGKVRDMVKKDLGEGNCMHTILYFNNNKNAIIIPVNDKNDYIIWSRFKNPGYYYDECTYPHDFVRISLIKPEYIRPIDDDLGIYLTSTEMDCFINFLKSPVKYLYKSNKSVYDFILEYINGETNINLVENSIPNYYNLIEEENI